MDELMMQIKESAQYIKDKIGDDPVELAIVLGSGLGALGDQIEDAVYIDYHDIPHFPVSTVPGHKGRLVIGKLEGKRIMCMQGRFHYYEGWSMDQCVYPIRTMFVLGIKSLILTNAAGCVNTAWKPGDIMLITDHIKLMPENPCRGMNHDELGARFFDMGSAYDKTLQQVGRDAAKAVGMNLREGVYMLFAGPNFETPAEVRFARFAGADACGMSTVPEAIAASQMRMHVLGYSCMTNMAAGILDQPLNHEEVIETGNRVAKDFQALVRKTIALWPKEFV